MKKQTLPSVEEMTHLIEDAQAAGCHPSVVQRLSVLKYFVEYRPTVLELCRHFGISRSTFHRWMDRFDATDVLSLQDKSQDGHAGVPTTVSSEAIDLIRRYRREAPLLGKERIASFLRQQHGILISASTVGRVIDRECLYFAETPLHWKKRINHGADAEELPDDPPVAPSLPQSVEQESAVPISVSASSSIPQTGGSIVHVHLANAGVSRTASSGFVRFIVLVSLLINIGFVAMLVGFALFEGSVRTVTARTDAAEIPAMEQSIERLHAAPSSDFLPQ